MVKKDGLSLKIGLFYDPDSQYDMKYKKVDKSHCLFSTPVVFLIKLIFQGAYHDRKQRTIT